MFVYGTLKRGRHLHRTYGFHNSEFLGEDTVKGELYTVGWYPVLYEDGEHVTDVPGEVFDVDEDTFKTVSRMEEAAGYETKKTKTKSGKNVYVFFYKGESNRIPANRIKEF